MHCTYCRKEFANIQAANRWPLFNSMANTAHPLWPHTPLPIPTHATRLLGNYASLWNAHQPIRDLLTNLSRHINTPTRAPEGMPANKSYEINFYSTSEMVIACKTAIQTLRQGQHSFDPNASFVVCLKQDAAATYCLSDFLGVTALSRNTTNVATMYANPLYTNPLAGQFVLETSLPHSPVAQESSTDDVDYFVPMADESSSDNPDYMVAMPTAAARDGSHYSQQTLFKVDTTRNWPNYDTGDATLHSTPRQWPANYETTLSAQAPNVQAEARYYSTVAEQKNGLFEKLAQHYEQFIVVFAHQPAHVHDDHCRMAFTVEEMESARLRAAPSYFQQAKSFLWRNTQRRVTTVVVTTVIIGGIVGAYLGVSSSAGSTSVSAKDRDCTYANGTNATFAELQETLATGNSSLNIPGLDPATCTLISAVINNTVSALKIGGYNCWQNVQSALMPLAASALALNSDSIQQIITSLKGYCFPSTTVAPFTSTTVPAGTTTVTTLTPTTSTSVFVSSNAPTTLQTSTSTSTPVTTTTLSTTTASTTVTTKPCCQFNVCIPYPFQNCRCSSYGNCPGNVQAFAAVCHAC